MPLKARKSSTVSRSPAKDVTVQPPPPASSSAHAAKNRSPPKTKMPPPPDPMPTTILGPEMQALEQSLKEAALNTGRIYRFYADTKKERIAPHAPYPPRSIARALGRSLERYDQICDTVETQLLHAISVLERDLKAEQARIEAEAFASVATRTRSKRPSVSPTATRIPLPNMSPPPLGTEAQILTESPTSTLLSSQFPPPSGASAISIAPRRPSTILSSLHRPSFPLKLDLSPAALAGNVDSSAMGPPMDVNVDLGLTSLPSPVTLAPKTARPLPNDPSIPDLFGVGVSTPQGLASNAADGPGSGDTGPMPGGVGMKGTVQDDVIDLTGPELSQSGTTQLGDTADKPIELDLEGSYDNMDLFGDVEPSANTADSTNTNMNTDGAHGVSSQLDVDMDGLFTPQDNETNAFQLDEAISQSVGTTAAPDPGAILASLTSGAVNDGVQTGNNADVASGEFGVDESAAPQFDFQAIDLSSFSGLFDASGDAAGGGGNIGGEDEMELMSQLLAMDGGDNVTTSTGTGDAGS